jgi:tetraacyldisaccharide 4'-kinase
VCIDPDRVAAARFLEQQGCDLLLSDDGLQHYRLGRAMEIAVVDGRRLLGNGYCLPVGPLREPSIRLREVDLVVVNSPDAEHQRALEALVVPQEVYSMQINPEHWVRLVDDAVLPLDTLAPQTVVDAIAGIGNPQRFYDTLRQLLLNPVARDFPDHHHYSADDFSFAGSSPLVMTAKDAVKCRAYARPDWYSLAVAAVLDDCFWQAFDAKIAALGVTPV